MAFPSKRKKIVAFIGIGANLGDRMANINKAIGCLKETKGITFIQASSFFESKPLGRAGPDYLNGAVKIATTLSARRLLKALLAIEAKLGRKRSFKNCPRIIDLDILLYADQRIKEPDLEIPHPRMLEREFVIKPLAELEPEFRKYAGC